MTSSTFKLAFRNLRKHKLPASINIAGLAIGIACCLLLFLYVDHELGFDRFHSNADRIYRVTYHAVEADGDTVNRAKTPPLVAPEMEATVTGVEETMRLGRQQLKVYNETLIDELQQVEFADPSLFEVFSFKLVGGDPGTALSDPSRAVISQENAIRYFGTTDAVGRTLTIDLNTGSTEFTISGVLAEHPSNSSIQLHLVLPYEQFSNTWGDFFRKATFGSWQMPLPVGETYVQLAPGVTATTVSAQLPEFVLANYGENDIQRRLELQPLTDIHLDTSITSGLEPVGNPMYSWLMGGVALMVLGIACINYVTMMLGRSVERAREVGIRKVVGADRRQIRRQFWGEALLTTVLAVVAGLALAELFLPTFNTLADKTLSLDLFQRPGLWITILGLVTGIAIVAGGYPALVLSRYEPARVLKGQVRAGGRNRLTRTLVTAQFALSIALLCGVLVMNRQLDYLIDADMGFDPSRMVVMNIAGTDNSASLFEALKNLADERSEVEEFTGSFFSFGSAGLDLELQEGDDPIVTAYMNPVADNFVEAMGIRLLEGTSLSQLSGERQVLVNEALVRALGWDDAVGKTLPVYEEAVFKEVAKDMVIAGVVEDFNVQSLHSEIEPVVLAPSSVMGGGVMAVSTRIVAGADSAILADFETVWREVAPDKPFQYRYMDDVIAAGYEEETRWRAIMAWAGGFVLAIASSGLFGLAVFSIRQRTKEIGIRKVLGSSVMGIVSLLSKEYALMVLFGAVVATPIAWIALNRWLASFAFRIDLNPWIFAASSAAALFTALATVGIQAARAAAADPVKSLRYE